MLLSTVFRILFTEAALQRRGQVLQTGMLSGTALTNLAHDSTHPINLLRVKDAAGILPSASNAPACRDDINRIEQGVLATDTNTSLEVENQRLKQQLQEVQEAAAQWQTLHSELHHFCVNKVIATAHT